MREATENYGKCPKCGAPGTEHFGTHYPSWNPALHDEPAPKMPLKIPIIQCRRCEHTRDMY